MTELVPFQTKRKKLFPSNTTPEQAIQFELEKYFKKIGVTVSMSTNTVSKVGDTQIKVLDQQSLPDDISMDFIISTLAPLCSPLLFSAKKEITITELERVVLILRKLATDTSTKETLEVVPKHYAKTITRLFTSQKTLDQLSVTLASNKRAKKYLRIMQKRLGIYKERKPPFRKIT